MKSSGFSQAYGFSSCVFDSRIRAYSALFRALISHVYEGIWKTCIFFNAASWFPALIGEVLQYFVEEQISRASCLRLSCF